MAILYAMQMDEGTAAVTGRLFDQVLAEAFAPVIGRPCWNVKQGFSNFLTLEFGNPSLVVREPRVVRSKS